MEMNIVNALKPNTLLVNPENNNDRYLIKKLINKGGFSFIYEADMIFYITSKIGEKEISRQEVVIKELFYPDKASRDKNSNTVNWSDEFEPNALSKKIKEKTLSEAIKLCGLSSDNILCIYSALDLNNTIYIVTKKIDGAEDFSKILKLNSDTPNKLSLKETLKYFNQICDALQEVHNQNIVHLDIKPENILRDSSGNAILIDFGISVSLVDGTPLTILGAETPHYSPPEQSLKDNKITFATDIYALGCTLYVFLTGQLVPRHSELSSGLENVIAPSYFNSEVTSFLDEVILKSINLKREERFQTVQEFLNAIHGEEKYNKLIDLAKKEYQLGKLVNLKNAIDYIAKSELIIPRTEEVTELLFDIRSEIKRISKDEEINEQISKADQLVNQKKYDQALKILRVVPQNTEINKKILFVENQLKMDKIQTLRIEALKFENENKIKEAIEKYKEINLLENNPKISKKIDDLQEQISKEEKYQNHINKGNEFENQLDYNSAYKEYSFASTYKPNDHALQNKLNFCLRKIEEQEHYNSDLETVIKIEKSKVVNPESIQRLISITQKYPNESYFAKVLLEKQTQWNRDLAMKAYYDKDYPKALQLFSKIHPQNSEDEKIIKEIQTYETLDDIKNGIYSGGYLPTISFLENVPKTIVQFQESQNLLLEVYFQYAKSLHKEKNYIEAKYYFSKITKNTANYIDSEQYIKFYQAVDAVQNNNFDVANALFSTVTYYELQTEVDRYKSEITHGKDDSLLKQAQQKKTEGKWQEALAILDKIQNHSTLYYQAQQLKSDIEKEIIRQQEGLENTFEKNYQDAQKALKNKEFSKAKSFIHQIPNTSKFYTQAQQLLVDIVNKENEKVIESNSPTKTKSGITKYVVIGGIAIGSVVGVKMLTNYNQNPVNTSLKPITDSTATKTVTEQKMTNKDTKEYDYYLFTGTTKNGLSNDEQGIGKYYKIFDGKQILVSTYKGSYKDGKRDGRGIEEYSLINLKTGEKIVTETQKIYEGNFADDHPSGTGKLTMSSGSYLVGEFSGYNAQQVIGEWYDEKGKLIKNQNKSASNAQVKK